VPLPDVDAPELGTPLVEPLAAPLALLPDPPVVAPVLE
jgi:hypothetical protein